jgi:hypothetical protein
MNVLKVLMVVLSPASTESEATTALAVSDIARPDMTAMIVMVCIIFYSVLKVTTNTFFRY